MEKLDKLQHVEKEYKKMKKYQEKEFVDRDAQTHQNQFQNGAGVQCSLINENMLELKNERIKELEKELEVQNQSF